MSTDATRRDFLKTAGAAIVAGAAAGTTVPAGMSAQSSGYPGDFSAAPIETVRIGFVGIGLQGGGHVENSED
jgi:hypothetical protein